ncbi:MAG: heme-binding domain-containing protein [Bacteroidales bacterium]|nr:heme-binding domain-containing protein [Bacteroidales bacterium]
MKKTVWIIIIVIIVGMQLIPVNRPDNSDDLSKDIIANNQIPENIANILKTSCYDCHSNQTKYPWYAYLAPVSFLVAKDVREGREELNFSEWENRNKSKKAKALDEIAEEVEEGEMPMEIYLITHPNAKLSDKQRKEFAEWAESYAESLFE